LLEKYLCVRGHAWLRKPPRLVNRYLDAENLLDTIVFKVDVLWCERSLRVDLNYLAVEWFVGPGVERYLCLLSNSYVADVAFWNIGAQIYRVQVYERKQGLSRHDDGSGLNSPGCDHASDGAQDLQVGDIGEDLISVCPGVGHLMLGTLEIVVGLQQLLLQAEQFLRLDWRVHAGRFCLLKLPFVSLQDSPCRLQTCVP